MDGDNLCPSASVKKASAKQILYLTPEYKNRKKTHIYTNARTSSEQLYNDAQETGIGGWPGWKEGFPLWLTHLMPRERITNSEYTNSKPAQ